ncbi:oxidoreductase-like domain-containing protein [uncultured Psychromonas sp.]
MRGIKANPRPNQPANGCHSGCIKKIPTIFQINFKETMKVRRF